MDSYEIIAIHRKPHTVLRRRPGTRKIEEPFFRETRAVQRRTAFSGAPCLKLSVYGYISTVLRCENNWRGWVLIIASVFFSE